jgi:hypothetical protein
VLLKNLPCNFRGGAGGVGGVLGGRHARPLPIYIIDAEIIPERCRLHTTASVGIQQNGIEPKSGTETVGCGEVAHSTYATGYRRIETHGFLAVCESAHTLRASREDTLIVHGARVRG